MENKDCYSKELIAKVEEMNNMDKTGLSFVEVYKPYSDLYNYTMMKIGLLSNEDKHKALESLKLANQKLNQANYE